MDDYSNETKSAPVSAWLGFSFSLFVLILIWLILYVGSNGNKDGLFGLFFLACTVGICFWILGLVFSIKGLKEAIRRNRSKWVGTVGVFFSIATVLSIIIPIVVASLKNDDNDRDMLAYNNLISSMEDDIRETTETDSDFTENNVVISVTLSSYIFCNDYRKGVDTVPAKISSYSYDLKHQLSTWLKMSHISKSTLIIIKTNQNADYSDVVKVIDTLKGLGYTNIKMTSSK